MKNIEATKLKRFIQWIFIPFLEKTQLNSIFYQKINKLNLVKRQDKNWLLPSIVPLMKQQSFVNLSKTSFELHFFLYSKTQQCVAVLLLHSCTLLENLKLCPKIQFSKKFKFWIWIFELRINDFWEYFNVRLTWIFWIIEPKIVILFKSRND